jgi:hypothetical protein
VDEILKINKSLIIFIIALFLLAFLVPQCLAQDSEVSRFISYQENYNYADCWNSLSLNEKTIYLLGVSDGIEKHDSDTKNFLHDNDETLIVNKPLSKEIDIDLKKVSKDEVVLYGWQIFVSNGGYRSIINNMNELYKDPANIYISLINMSFLSLYKSKNEPVEILLKEMHESGKSLKSLLDDLRERSWRKE